MPESGLDCSEEGYFRQLCCLSVVYDSAIAAHVMKEAFVVANCSLRAVRVASFKFRVHEAEGATLTRGTRLLSNCQSVSSDWLS